MKLIVGLGNPGFRYRSTRHNIGFMALDRMAETSGIRLKKRTAHSLFGMGKIGDQEIFLAKPLTYMNLSGKAVSEIVKSRDLSLDDLLVVMDDKDLPLGRIRLRQKGSPGGHNGLRSVAEELGTEEFPRLRIGIGPNINILRDHVLTPFRRDEREALKDVLESSKRCIEIWIMDGIDTAMNRFNP